MKLKLKTTFWHYKEELFKDKTYKVIVFLMIPLGVNIFHLIMNKVWWLVTINCIYFLILLGITDTYFKYKKEIEKNG